MKVYKISTSDMNDYDRNGEKSATQWSRYGAVADLDATTEEFTLTKDRGVDAGRHHQHPASLRHLRIVQGLRRRQNLVVDVGGGQGFGEDYTIHENPPGISGSLVEGRICYGAFVLDNKVKAIYYQALPAAGERLPSWRQSRRLGACW